MGDRISVILYLRVSTEEQGRQGYSLPEQRRECRARAEAIAREKGAALEVREYLDTASGQVLDRPGLDACRHLLRQREAPADYFICLDPDRFARSLFLQLLVTEEIEKAGLQLVFVQHDYQTSAEGRLFYQMRGAISEFEKAKIKERTARGRRGKLAAGLIPNRVQPWGYTWNSETKRLEVNESQAPWVRQVFRWYLEGRSYLRIAARLGELGVPAPGGGRWYRRSVQRILQNPVYAGRLVLNKWDAAGRTPLRKVPRAKRLPLTARLKPEAEWVTLPASPLITEAEWVRVRELHRSRTRLSQPGVGLLSGLCICGICGSRIHYAGEAGRRYLRCSGRYPRSRDFSSGARAAPACTLRNTRAGPIEAAVWAQIGEWLHEPEELERARQDQPETTTENEKALRELPLLQQLLAERREEHRRIFRLAARGLAPADVDQQLERLTAQLKAIEAELAALTVENEGSASPPADSLAGSAPGLPEQVRRELEALDPAGRQHTVRVLVQEVTIFSNGGWSCRCR